MAKNQNEEQNNFLHDKINLQTEAHIMNLESFITRISRQCASCAAQVKNRTTMSAIINQFQNCSREFYFKSSLISVLATEE